MISAEASITAQFYDLDPMGVVWHGNYARFFEQARCALLDKIGFNYEEMARTRYIWPIVDMRIKYVRPILFSQRFTVVAQLDEYESRIKIRYRILDPASGEVLTKAETTQVAVDKESHEVCLDSPPEFVAKVRGLL